MAKKIELRRVMVVTGRVTVHFEGKGGSLVTSDPFVLRVVGSVDGRVAKIATDFLTDQYSSRGYVVTVAIRDVRLVPGDRGWILVGGES